MGLGVIYKGVEVPLSSGVMKCAVGDGPCVVALQFSYNFPAEINLNLVSSNALT